MLNYVTISDNAVIPSYECQNEKWAEFTRNSGRLNIEILIKFWLFHALFLTFKFLRIGPMSVCICLSDFMIYAALYLCTLLLVIT
jgi:hypothetical protein